MSNYNNQQPQGREKTIFNDYRIGHPKTKEIASGAKYPGQMTWEISKNGEIIGKFNDGVYDPNNKNAGKMKEVKLNALERGSVFNAILSAATNPNFTSLQIPIRRREFINDGGRPRLSEKEITICEFTIMRDKNGVLCLGYRKGDYRVMFELTSHANVIKTFKDGKWEEDHATTSNMYVLSYFNWVKKGLEELEIARHTPPKPKDGGNGGNGGNGGGWNNNNNGGGNNNSGGNGGGYSGDGDFDEDIPF